MIKIDENSKKPLLIGKIFVLSIVPFLSFLVFDEMKIFRQKIFLLFGILVFVSHISLWYFSENEHISFLYFFSIFSMLISLREVANNLEIKNTKLYFISALASSFVVIVLSILPKFSFGGIIISCCVLSVQIFYTTLIFNNLGQSNTA